MESTVISTNYISYEYLYWEHSNKRSFITLSRMGAMKTYITDDYIVPP